MNYFILRNLLLTLLFVLSPLNSFACDKTPLTVENAFQSADYVFSASVENIQYLDDPKQLKTEPRIIVSMKTNEVWKGEKQPQYLLHTTHNKWSCNGYAFKAGENYLVFAKQQKRADNFLARLFSPKQATLGVKLYAGTKLLKDAKNDLQALNKNIAGSN